MDFLVEYAEDWDKRFRPSDSRADQLRYFTQEYWYLFTAIMRAEDDGEPLNRKRAFEVMRVPYDDATLDLRIGDAIQDGYITKDDHPTDKRKVLYLPTIKLRERMAEHLAFTLQRAREILANHPQDAPGNSSGKLG